MVEQIPMVDWKALDLEEVGMWRKEDFEVTKKGLTFKSDWKPYTLEGEPWKVTKSTDYLKLGQKGDFKQQ